MVTFATVMEVTSIEEDQEENKAKKTEYKNKMIELQDRQTPAYVGLVASSSDA